MNNVFQFGSGKLLVVIATSGKWEDTWRHPVLISADRAKLEEFIADQLSLNEKVRGGSGHLVKFIEDFGDGPKLEWTPESVEADEKTYQEWEDNVLTPAKIAFLMTKGFTEEEAKMVPEYPEDSIHYSIEEVEFI